jgi:SAM-dependent methyltransferase
MSTYPPPIIFTDMARIATDRVVPDWIPQSRYGNNINVGAGSKQVTGATMVDLEPDDSASVFVRWDADTGDPMPFQDGSVDSIYAVHFLEHIQDPIRALREFQRVLRPGGVLNIAVPHYNSNGAHMDLDHKHFFSEKTWNNLFNNDHYAKNHGGWEWEIGANFIFGLVERNLMVITQLVRR